LNEKPIAPHVDESRGIGLDGQESVGGGGPAVKVHVVGFHDEPLVFADHSLDHALGLEVLDRAEVGDVVAKKRRVVGGSQNPTDRQTPFIWLAGF